MQVQTKASIDQGYKKVAQMIEPVKHSVKEMTEYMGKEFHELRRFHIKSEETIMGALSSQFDHVIDVVNDQFRQMFSLQEKNFQLTKEVADARSQDHDLLMAEMRGKYSELLQFMQTAVNEENSAKAHEMGSIKSEKVEEKMSAVKGVSDLSGRKKKKSRKHKKAKKHFTSSSDENSSAEEKTSQSESESEIESHMSQKTNKTDYYKKFKIPAFTGNESWKVWYTRFKEVASRRGLSKEERLDELLPKLQGEAGEFVYDQLNSNARKDYKRLTTELKNRFRKVENPKTYGTKFAACNQRVVQSAEDYAAELKKLYDKAFVGRDRRTRDEDLLRRFLVV